MAFLTKQRQHMPMPIPRQRQTLRRNSANISYLPSVHRFNCYPDQALKVDDPVIWVRIVLIPPLCDKAPGEVKETALETTSVINAALSFMFVPSNIEADSQVFSLFLRYNNTPKHLFKPTEMRLHSRHQQITIRYLFHNMFVCEECQTIGIKSLHKIWSMLGSCGHFNPITFHTPILPKF